MGLEIGIVGLPNVGKSTLFNALLKRQIAQVAEYPYTTIEPNVGVVEVPDERLTQLTEIVKQSESRKRAVKIVPAAIKFIDIAGLIKDAHKGAGLGGQFLGKIREVDAILQVVRDFENPLVTHVLGKNNPARDIELVNQELSLAGIKKPTFSYLNRQFPDDSTLTKIIKECYRLLDLVTVFTIEGGEIVQAWPVKRGLTIREVAGKIHSDFLEKFIRAEVVSFSKLLAAFSYEKAKKAGWVKVKGRDYQVQDGDVVTIKI